MRRYWSRTPAFGVAALALAIASGPSNAGFSEGDFWEYLWTTRSVSATPSNVTRQTQVGRFTATLGPRMVIDGVTAFPLTIEGETSDGIIDYRPRWSHLALDGAGNLLGSVDGESLGLVFAAAGSGSGGYFFEIPAADDVRANDEVFDGEFNRLDAQVLRRSNSPGECVDFPEIGTTVCPDQEPEVSITAAEYFKPGLGPIGARQSFLAIFDGGGFDSSEEDERSVELIRTSLNAQDGQVVLPPPWTPRAGLATGRYRHGVTGHEGKLYVAGGIDGSAQPLASVEVYDPEADVWAAGPPLPAGYGSARIHSAAGELFVLSTFGSQAMLQLDGTREDWTELPANPSFSDSCVVDGRLIVGIRESFGELSPRIFDPATGEWSFGTRSSSGASPNFSVACTGAEVIVTGGGDARFGQTRDVRVYDVGADGWGVGPRLGKGRQQHAAAVFRGELVVLGGFALGEGALRTVERLGSGATEWRAGASFYVPRGDNRAAVLGASLFLVGGSERGLGSSRVTRLDAPERVFASGFESAP